MASHAASENGMAEREAKLAPVAACIALMAAAILGGSYLIGNFLF